MTLKKILFFFMEVHTSGLYLLPNSSNILPQIFPSNVTDITILGHFVGERKYSRLRVFKDASNSGQNNLLCIGTVYALLGGISVIKIISYYGCEVCVGLNFIAVGHGDIMHSSGVR